MLRRLPVACSLRHGHERAGSQPLYATVASNAQSARGHGGRRAGEFPDFGTPGFGQYVWASAQIVALMQRRTESQVRCGVGVRRHSDRQPTLPGQLWMTKGAIRGRWLVIRRHRFNRTCCRKNEHASRQTIA